MQWVDAVKADTSSAPDRVKVARHRPAAAVDGCWTDPTTFVAEPQTFSSKPDSTCNAKFPTYAFPRSVAGEPVQANVYRCHLKPIDPADYTAAFTPEEMARLQAIFPSGVCDYSQRGVGYRRVVTWPSFGPSPDNLVFDVTNPDRRASDGEQED